MLQSSLVIWQVYLSEQHNLEVVMVGQDRAARRIGRELAEMAREPPPQDFQIHLLPIGWSDREFSDITLVWKDSHQF